MTRVQLLSLHNNNNRRRDVFCAKKEARDGRLKGEERGNKIKCKRERISKHWEGENDEDEERWKTKNRENNRKQDEIGESGEKRGGKNRGKQGKLSEAQVLQGPKETNNNHINLNINNFNQL